MIDRIYLRFGSRPGEPSLSFDVAQINVFVGPNNSGKSLVLREIEEYCEGRYINNQSYKIVADVDFAPQTAESLEQELLQMQNDRIPGAIFHDDGTIQFNFINSFGRRSGHGINRATLINSAADERKRQRHGYVQSFVSFYTMKLDGTTRMNLINPQEYRNAKDAPQNHMAVLFRDDTKRIQLRELVYKAFGIYLLVDPTNPGSLSFSFSTNAPDSVELERGLHERAIEYYKNTTSIRVYP